jgi:hypothetical protein
MVLMDSSVSRKSTLVPCSKKFQPPELVHRDPCSLHQVPSSDLSRGERSLPSLRDSKAEESVRDGWMPPKITIASLRHFLFNTSAAFTHRTRTTCGAC